MSPYFVPLPGLLLFSTGLAAFLGSWAMLNLLNQWFQDRIEQAYSDSKSSENPLGEELSKKLVRFWSDIQKTCFILIQLFLGLMLLAWVYMVGGYVIIVSELNWWGSLLCPFFLIILYFVLHSCVRIFWQTYSVMEFLLQPTTVRLD